MAIIVIITKASVSSLESSCFSTYSGAPQGHHVIFPAKGPPPCPLPHIYHCYISYINISLLHPRWDEQCRDTMMTVPPQLTSSLPSFSYPASFRHPPPASSGTMQRDNMMSLKDQEMERLGIYIYMYKYSNVFAQYVSILFGQGSRLKGGHGPWAMGISTHGMNGVKTWSLDVEIPTQTMWQEWSKIPMTCFYSCLPRWMGLHSALYTYYIYIK